MNYKNSERDAEIFEARQRGETFASIGRRYGISTSRALSIFDAETRRRKGVEFVSNKDWRTMMPLEALGFGVRAQCCLRNAFHGLTMGEIAEQFSSGDFTRPMSERVPGFGKKSWEEIVVWLAKKGVELPDAAKPKPTLPLDRRLKMIRDKIAKLKAQEAEVLRLLGR
jgi:hypothetical protein